MTIRKVVILVLFLTLVHSQSNDLWDTYSRCRSSLGNTSWVCDPHGKLTDKALTGRLDDLLWRLQTDVPCFCTKQGDCYRYSNISIQSGVLGALIVTAHLPNDAEAVSKRIYEDANLAASKTCDNGLLVIYAMDDQKLHVTRGGLLEQMFFSEDADSVLNRTSEVLETSDYTTALPALLEQYVSRLQGDTYSHRRGWEWIVGIVVASVIGLFAAAVIVGLCCTRYCNKKKSLSSPPPPPLFKKEHAKVMSATRRVRRKRNKVIARDKKAEEKSRTISGRPVTPKRLASAKRRLFRKQTKKHKKTIEEQKAQAALTPSPGSEDQYYLISEPASTIYAPPYGSQNTLRAAGGGGTESPYAVGTIRPPSTSGYQPPAILYPDSQAVFNYPPSPKRETQRRDTYIYEGTRETTPRSSLRPA